jgi:hypothetical protein
VAAKRDASLLAGFAGASSWRVKRLELHLARASSI